MSAKVLTIEGMGLPILKCQIAGTSCAHRVHTLYIPQPQKKRAPDQMIGALFTNF
jgi:hypothetical protein